LKENIFSSKSECKDVVEYISEKEFHLNSRKIGLSQILKLKISLFAIISELLKELSLRCLMQKVQTNTETQK
jgi:inorganic pyrophosphatase/exopolyphosphatase